jgi:serine/threonine-protein kinase HipA
MLNLCERHGEYILKPIPLSKQLLNLQDAPANEHISMQLADRVFDIPTASNGIIYFRKGEPAYITRRFDINEHGEKYLMEDFAQLSQKLPEKSGESYKYEGTYEEIGELIKKYVTASIPSLEGFFKLILFNYIICNGDAHLKNFSLLRSPSGEYFLSPAYDLMSTILHSPTESDTALQLYEGDLNSAFYSSFGFYGRPNFMELADKLGIVEKRAMRIFQTCVSRKNEILSFLEQSTLSTEGKKSYAANVLERIGRLSQ